jgi:FKBP-type peptidyl-prolyl cis-trans isomerase FkpA
MIAMVLGSLLSRRALVSIPLLLAIAGGGACSKSPTSPSNATVTHTDLRIGAGDEATSGATITVNYTGWLYDASKPDQKGLQIDTSAGRAAFTFTLGAGQVIPGWDQGLPGMKAGGLRRLLIPPSLAYGNVRYGPIPPESTLVFEIELVSVQQPSS